MNKLQIIQSPQGQDQYVLLPVSIYQSLRDTIAQKLVELDKQTNNDDYVLFDPADYIENPVAVARIDAGFTREELAKRLGISVAYLGQIERRTQVTEKMLARVMRAIQQSRRAASCADTRK